MDLLANLCPAQLWSHRKLFSMHVWFQITNLCKSILWRYSSQCKNRQIYYVECAIAKCGINTGQWEEIGSDKRGSKKAFPGYWPWFAKINLNGNYFCEGTLLSADTVLAQSSCFHMERQLLSSHNLSVTLASVRFQQDNIEAQRFSVSQVTALAGNDLEPKLHLVRLTESSNATRYIRPVCHKTDIFASTNNFTSLNCVVIGLNYELDQLQSRQVHIVANEKCHLQLDHFNSSTPWTSAEQKTRQHLCVEFSESEWPEHCTNHVGSTECTGFGNAGRHLFCQFKSSWHLIGVESASTTTKVSTDTSKFMIIFELLPRLSV